MIDRIGQWLRTVFLRRRLDAEMQEEMALHLRQSAERLIARGMTPEAAREAARREFGNVAFLQEEARDARGARWVESTTRRRGSPRTTTARSSATFRPRGIFSGSGAR